MLECSHCGGKLDVTMAECPTCGSPVEMRRLTGILGIVCRSCDAYNEPGTKNCVSCGQPLSLSRVPTSPPLPAPAVPGPRPAPGDAVFAEPTIPSLSELPPLDLEAVPVAPVPAPVAAPVQPLSPFGEFDLEPLPLRAGTGSAIAPVASAPANGQGSEGPSAAAVRGSEPADQTQPIPLVTACPHCGEEAGGGDWCVRCGRPIGLAHTRPMAASPPGPGERTPSQVFGPPEPGKATLVLERGAGFEGAVFRLSGQDVGAGRTQGSILFPDDGALAPRHVTFFYRDGRLYLRDEGSSGGTYVRLRGSSVPLKPGDLFALGDRLLRFAGLLPAAPPSLSDGTRRLGSPRPAGPAILVEERLEGGVTGRVWLRPGPSVTLGRVGCAINLGDDPFLSQAHAEILVEADGSAKLRDLGSSNGTFVRLSARSERELRDGDVLRIGREVLRVVSGPS